MRKEMDLSMNTEAALLERAALKEHPAVAAAVAALWDALPKCPAPHSDVIDRQIYSSLAVWIYERDLPAEEQWNALQMIPRDWFKESRGEFFMDYAAFFDGVFAYVDLFTSRICAKKYEARLQALVTVAKTRRNTFFYSPAVAEKHWQEWLEYNDFAPRVESDEAFAVSKFVVKKRIPTALSPAVLPFARFGRRERRPSVCSSAGSRASSRASSRSSLSGMSVRTKRDLISSRRSTPCPSPRSTPSPSPPHTAPGQFLELPPLPHASRFPPL